MALRRRRKPPQGKPPQRKPGAGFHLTPLDQPVPRPDPPAAPPAPPRATPPAPPPAPAAPPAPGDVVGARYRHPADALTFLAAVQDASGYHYPPVHRADDGAIWVVMRRQETARIELASALGATIHRPDGPDLVSLGGRRYPWAAMREWPVASLVELAADVAPGTRTAEQHELVIVTAGSLARWMIERFHSADVDLRLATVQLRSLFRTRTSEWGAVLLRVTAQGRTVPRAFAEAIGRLPDTVVCRTGGERLLVDQRLTLPLPDEELARSVPEGREWLLAAGLGAWEVTGHGPEHPPRLGGAGRLRPPSVPLPASRPPDLGVEVRLVRDDRPRPVDARLLTDDDLAPLRRFLTGQPTGERALLVLGPGSHLLAEPGRGMDDIPFGVPLCRVGPGALYLEVGYRLQPALPGPARARLFDVDERSLVVLAAAGTHRLASRDTVPLWSLWLGPAEPADPERVPLSAAAVEILEQVDAAGARAEPFAPPADTPVEARSELRTEGFLLEQQGKFAEAARRYWEAGEHVLAAKLYELAAEADR